MPINNDDAKRAIAAALPSTNFVIYSSLNNHWGREIYSAAMARYESNVNISNDNASFARIVGILQNAVALMKQNELAFLRKMGISGEAIEMAYNKGDIKAIMQAFKEINKIKKDLHNFAIDAKKDEQMDIQSKNESYSLAPIFDATAIEGFVKKIFNKDKNSIAGQVANMVGAKLNSGTGYDDKAIAQLAEKAFSDAVGINMQNGFTIGTPFYSILKSTMNNIVKQYRMKNSGYSVNFDSSRRAYVSKLMAFKNSLDSIKQVIGDNENLSVLAQNIDDLIKQNGDKKRITVSKEMADKITSIAQEFSDKTGNKKIFSAEDITEAITQNIKVDVFGEINDAISFVKALALSEIGKNLASPMVLVGGDQIKGKNDITLVIGPNGNISKTIANKIVRVMKTKLKDGKSAADVLRVKETAENFDKTMQNIINNSKITSKNDAYYILQDSVKTYQQSYNIHGGSLGEKLSEKAMNLSDTLNMLNIDTLSKNDLAFIFANTGKQLLSAKLPNNIAAVLTFAAVASMFDYVSFDFSKSIKTVNFFQFDNAIMPESCVLEEIVIKLRQMIEPLLVAKGSLLESDIKIYNKMPSLAQAKEAVRENGLIPAFNEYAGMAESQVDVRLQLAKNFLSIVAELMQIT